jgi:hypothetical protein
MHKKSHIPSLILIITTIALLLSTLISTSTSSATVVWQDDFNDGDFDLWTIDYGDFGITGNALEATGAVGWNFIRHPSTVAYGSWSFDVLAEPAPDNHSYVYIIAGIGDALPNYRLCIWTDPFSTGGTVYTTGPGVSLLKQPGAIETTTSIAGWVTDYSFVGTWHSINVTRDSNGLFTIRVDGTTRITITDNELATSTHFRFGAQENSAIDNIIVSDFPSGSTNTPPPIPGFPLLAILIGVPLAISISVLRRRTRIR